MDLKFREWVRSQPAQDNARGDFIRDVRDDKEFPARIYSWSTLESYLFEYNACDSLLEQARQLWLEYQRVHQLWLEDYNNVTGKCATCIPGVDCDFFRTDFDDPVLEELMIACTQPARMLAIQVSDAAHSLVDKRVNLNDRAAIEKTLGWFLERKPPGFIERAIRCAFEWDPPSPRALD